MPVKPYWQSEDVTLYQGDVLEILREMPSESVQCCITSPPYWGGLRDYGVGGQLGIEPTPEEYIAKMVEVFREVTRVLRKDGTLWLNMGDCYAHGPCGGGSVFDDGRRDGRISYDADKPRGREATTKRNTVVSGLKPKDLVGMPWRLAFALQADGWWLRSDIVWAKLNPMPESVTDRPTRAHEYVFLMTNSGKYFYDANAIRERSQATDTSIKRAEYGRYDAGTGKAKRDARNGKVDYLQTIGNDYGGSRRNKRTVWTIPTAPYAAAHFATYPPKLVEPCIKAGTSERGACRECGAPWKRIKSQAHGGSIGKTWADHSRTAIQGGKITVAAAKATNGINKYSPSETIGWGPTCSCNTESVPCVVLDPFIGSGTTAIVARLLGRHCIGIDLNAEYLDLAIKRINSAWELEPEMEIAGQRAVQGDMLKGA